VVNVQPLSDGDPRRLGDYDVTGRLGEGGQGIVYLGRGSGGSVAIKLLHAQLIEDEPARARFVREVEVTKRVARFCTAQVLSVGSSQAGRTSSASTSRDRRCTGSSVTRGHGTARRWTAWRSTRRRHWPRSTRRASSTATSSRPTS
jgi:hypothetical protein